MAATFVLIGHCGPDSFMMKNAISRAVPGAELIFADDHQSLQPHLGGSSVLLVNRLLDGSDFNTDDGIALIQSILATHPQQQAMLVSNHADAQQRANEAGALPGFGKRELNTPRVAELLRNVAETH